MQQVADWLEKLGLGQYAQRFAENEIDVSVLRHLTDQDLKKRALNRLGIAEASCVRSPISNLGAFSTPDYRCSLRATQRRRARPGERASGHQYSLIFTAGSGRGDRLGDHRCDRGAGARGCDRLEVRA